MSRIAIGCDPNAREHKEAVMKLLDELGYEYQDYGSQDPIYANVAIAVAEAVAAGEHDQGVLICGTGIGVSLAVNKVQGAYAALCADAYSTERARKSNNANIICLGAQVAGSSWPRPWSGSGLRVITPRADGPNPRSSASWIMTGSGPEVDNRPGPLPAGEVG
jgi:ribose 5-phosphate isomerase B